jgi:hypothetical protein
MSKLRHETPEDYIAGCREYVRAERGFIQALEQRKERHMRESGMISHEDCNLCALMDEVTADEYGLLVGYTEQYQRARRGMYE